MENSQRIDPVKFGSMVSVNDKIGISHLERFAAYGLGNYVNLKIHWHRDTQVTRPTIEKAVKFCVENKIYFSFSEFLDRYTYIPWKILDTLTRQDWIELQELGGKYCLGNHSICERGGAVYWPLGYKHDSLLLERAENVKAASEIYMAGIRKALETEHRFGRKNLECIDSSFLHKYHFQAGMDGAAIEMFPGNCDRMYPAVRGASRAYGRETFGADVAMVWYGGVEKDELWFKRWQMSLYYAYLAGTDWITEYDLIDTNKNYSDMAKTNGEGEDLKLETSPSVVLVIGVNGAGKTTGIGKISNKLKKDGKKVVVAAADTFRAAAIDQLEVWCQRAKVEIVKQNEGSDPAAVVFDAINYAKKKEADVLIIDTAGRLHNKANLMNELAKINRVIDRELPDASRENLLVLDATTGQNAVIQAKEFSKAANITGITLNKLDGTAKGGIVISIKRELGIPVKFIGVGEKIDDMQEFDAKQFVDALFE
jgi:fused signal recognition particle receptor